MLGGSVHALLLGPPGIAGAAAELGSLWRGLISGWGSRMPCRGTIHNGMPWSVAEAVKNGGYGAVLFGATAQGKDLAPRVAAILDRSPGVGHYGVRRGGRCRDGREAALLG
jgi:electron transfer flavoprotein alpha subunit